MSDLSSPPPFLVTLFWLTTELPWAAIYDLNIRPHGPPYYDLMSVIDEGYLISRTNTAQNYPTITGGNCECTVADEVVIENDVTIMGKTNYSSEMAAQASDFLARNFIAFLDVLGQGQDVVSIRSAIPIQWRFSNF